MSLTKPSRDDSVTQLLSESIGGPLGSHAGRPRSWTPWRTAVAIAVLGSCVWYLLGYAGFSLASGPFAVRPSAAVGLIPVTMAVAVSAWALAIAAGAEAWRAMLWALSPLLMLTAVSDWRVLAVVGTLGALAAWQWSVMAYVRSSSAASVLMSAAVGGCFAGLAVVIAAWPVVVVVVALAAMIKRARGAGGGQQLASWVALLATVVAYLAAEVVRAALELTSSGQLALLKEWRGFWRGTPEFGTLWSAFAERDVVIVPEVMAGLAVVLTVIALGAVLTWRLGTDDLSAAAFGRQTAALALPPLVVWLVFSPSTHVTDVLAVVALGALAMRRTVHLMWWQAIELVMVVALALSTVRLKDGKSLVADSSGQATPLVVSAIVVLVVAKLALAAVDLWRLHVDERTSTS